jgi:hypothetical protein
MTDSTLLKLNGAAALFHLVQAGYTFGLTNSVFKDKGIYTISNGTNTLPSYHIGNLVGVFPLLAAIDHGWSVIDSKKYLEYVDKGYNPVRWIEYSASAGIMFFIVAQLSEIKDIKLLYLILGSNMVLQYFGYSTEKNTANGNVVQANADNNVGFVLFISIWIPIFISFFTALQTSDEDPPGAVYSIIFVMFALFLLFGLLNLAYVRGKKKNSNNIWKLKQQDFRKIELGYTILSFVSKTLLTNLTLFGALSKPNL